MSISEKDVANFRAVIESMTLKFIAIFEDTHNQVSDSFSWFTFRDETMLTAVEYSFGKLTIEDALLYRRIFDETMSTQGYKIVSASNLDDKIEIWHTTPSLNMELNEYLGLSKPDYSRFVFGQSVYHKI
jgi:hypothetical protein